MKPFNRNACREAAEAAEETISSLRQEVSMLINSTRNENDVIDVVGYFMLVELKVRSCVVRVPPASDGTRHVIFLFVSWLSC